MEQTVYKSTYQKKRKKAAAGSYPELVARQNVMLLVMGVCFAMLVGALGWYQIVNNEWWTQKAVEQQLRDSTLPAKRGTIYDVNGEKLVESSDAWSVSLWYNSANVADPEKNRKGDPKNIKPEHREAIAEKLVEILGLSPEYIGMRMDMLDNPNYSEVTIRGKYDKTQKNELESFIYDENGKVQIPGIIIRDNTARYYYRENLLSSVLGYTGTDNSGLAGLEFQYNTVLSGTPGRVVEARNAQNEAMPFEYQWRKDAEDGNSLVLTIDSTVQSILEKYLRKAVLDNDVRNKACGIIMNVNTGAILGMANYPNYNPAEYTTIIDDKLRAKIDAMPDSPEKDQARSDAIMAQSRNKAIIDTYEPGSVFKPVTMAAALENGSTSVNDGFNCSGFRMIGSVRKNCHKAGGHGQQSLEQGMMNSCNPVFMTLAERMGVKTFFKYYSAFGLDEKTGIDLPSEQKGLCYNADNAKAVDLANSSFGQSNTVTPLQMITAIAAVTNGGYLVTPHVVSQIIDSDGNLVENIEPQIRRQVISAQTSQTVTSMLEKTVASGTARNAYVKGYRIGGKTGTSEKLFETNKLGFAVYIASFCAVAPCDKPEIAMLIMLDDPRGASHMGGAIAAPVARNILGEILPYLGIDTIYTTDDLENIDVLIPDMVGLNTADAKAGLEAKGLSARVIGGGETVVNQIPRGGAIPKGSKIVLLTEPEGAVPMSAVPNVRGMNPSQANAAIVNAGFNIRFTGTGYNSTLGQAITQDPPPGGSVPAGTIVTVEFTVSGATD